jgi:transposase-like protein
VKKEYQIQAQRAVEQFQAWADGNVDPVQLAFPTPDMVRLAQQGLGELLRQVGKIFIENVMECEVEQLAGKRSQPDRKRSAYRWGIEQGYVIVDGQKVPIAKPRVRNVQHNREIPLGSYELFQRASLIEESVWQKIMYGLTMRSYKEVVQQFADAYGLEKSTTSEHFIEASRKKLEQLLTRSLSGLNLCAIFVDGTIFKGEHLVVAIGLDRLGRKIVLGIRQGATENATLVGDLFADLINRGVDFSQPRLYILDGSKALRSAIGSYAGEAAFIQRCQVHKIRNVAEYLPEPQRHAVKFRMRAAYLKDNAADARNLLLKLHDELIEVNPSAAASLAEGLDETLTLLDLQIRHKLRQCLSSTNGIESGFSTVDKICRQVKRWQGSDHRLRWVASALLFAESRWHRIHGCTHLPMLLSAMENEYQRRLQSKQVVLKRHLGAA